MKTHPFTHLKAAALASVAVAAGFASANAQTLTVTNDLRLWLMADAGITTNLSGVVTNWADQSTNANNAYTNVAVANSGPLFVDNVINGKPVVRFAGSPAQDLRVSASPSFNITGDMALFAVVNFGPAGGRRSIWAQDSGGSSKNYGLESSSDRLDKPRLNRGGNTLDTQFVIRTNQFLVMGFQQAGADVSHYRSDQRVYTQVNDVAVTDSGTSGRIGNGGGPMKGDIAEILIYGTALSDADRLAVINYLETKYALTNQPPTVSLASDPADGSTVGTPANVTLTATASDSDGTIDHVGFYANNQLLGTAAAPPYQLTVAVRTPGTAVFTAVAWDNRDKTGSSAPVSLTVTGAVPVLSVTASNSLQVWLDAGAGVTTNASGAVTNWTDQSGHGNDAIQTNDINAPMLVANAVNGRAALHFDGDVVDANLDYMSIAPNYEMLGTNNDKVTSLFVISFDDMGGSVYPRWVWGQTDTNGLAKPMYDYITAFGNGFFRASRNFGADGANLGDTVVSAAIAVPRQTYMVAGFNMADAGPVGTTTNVTTHYWNGLRIGVGSHAVGATNLLKPLLIGVQRADVRGPALCRMRGQIAELMIFRPALSDADMVAAESYLAAKYDIPFIVPLQRLTLTLSGTNALISKLAVRTPPGLTLQSSSDLSAWTSDTNKETLVTIMANASYIQSWITNALNNTQLFYKLTAP